MTVLTMAKDLERNHFEISLYALTGLIREDLTDEWHFRLQESCQKNGLMLGGLRITPEQEIDEKVHREPGFERLITVTDAQTGNTSTIGIVDNLILGTDLKVDYSIVQQVHANELLHGCLKKAEIFLRSLIQVNKAYLGTMVVDDGERKLWIGGNAERIERFNRLEWPQDTERALLLEWLSKPGAELVSEEDANYFIMAGEEKALLLQSPINGMLLPVSKEARSQYHQFVDEAWECELEKTLPFASLDDWIDRHGEPDFELPAVEFEGDHQNVVRQIGYLNMSPNYVVILRSYEDGSITIILAGKAVDSL